MKNKQKVLHTRVSEELYDKISTKAKKHRITISNFIRSLVEDYIELSGDIFDIADDKIREYLKNNVDKIVAYQQVDLSINTRCEICGKEMKKGIKANIAIFNKSSRNKVAVVCNDCRTEIEKETKD